MNNSKKSLYIIDGNSLLYRAFFAVPAFSTSKGLPTNAVFGFTKMLLKIIKEKQPQALVVVFDSKGPTFREEIYEDYKAHREKMPDDLVLQRPYIQKMVEGFAIPVLQVESMEADDIIGTLVKKFSNDYVTFMVTSDKDMMQFVEDDKVFLYDTMKDKVYDRKGVHEKMGAYPEQIIDLLALMGDSSDNIPGVRGVGPKTAANLLEKHQTLDGVYEHIDEITGALHDKLKTSQELAYVSKKLTTIKTDVDLDITEENMHYKGPDIHTLYRVCDELEFSSLKKDIMDFGSFDTDLYQPKKEVHEKRYITIESQKMFDEVMKEIESKGEFAFDTETTSTNTLEANLVGIALSCNKNIGYYVPIAHQNYDKNLDKEYVLEKLFFLFENDGIRKYAHNIKFDMAVLERARKGIEKTGDGFIPKKKEEGQMKMF